MMHMFDTNRNIRLNLYILERYKYLKAVTQNKHLKFYTHCLSLPVYGSDVVKQLSVFEELLLLSPAVLISDHERQHVAGLREEVARLTQKLEKTLAASEKEKV